MDDLALTARLKRSAGFELELLGNDLLLYYPDKELILALNPTGGLIWNLMDGKRSLAEIIRSLCDAYPDAQDRIPNQVMETVRSLLEQDALIQIAAEQEQPARPVAATPE
jgi:hypothetical protein